MIGQGVLHACLHDPAVEQVLCVGRSATGQTHAKVRELVHRDLSDYSAVEAELAGYDACFYCLGISSAGLSEPDYRRVTYDFALAAAQALVRRNPAMTFVFVSGQGTDSTGKGRTMWARVKGETENALFALPFKGVYAFRPGFVQPVHGETSKTRLYSALYSVMGPLYPVFKRVLPGSTTTTENMGRAMLRAAREGAPTRVLECADINALAGA